MEGTIYRKVATTRPQFARNDALKALLLSMAAYHYEKEIIPGLEGGVGAQTTDLRGLTINTIGLA